MKNFNLQMETASFTGFIKAVLYIIIFYYIFKFLARIFLPILFRKVVQKAGQNFQQQYTNQQQNNYQSSNRDEIIYDTAKSKNPKTTKKIGEYVDYEEIE